MNIFWLLLILSTLTVIIAWRAIRGRRYKIRENSEVNALLVPLDLIAFKNICDRQEEDFLRSVLAEPEFEKLRKERARVAFAYVRALARNASILLSLGQMAKRSKNESIAAAGVQLIEEALATRILALKVEVKLLGLIVFPDVSVSIADLLSRYEQLQKEMLTLCQLSQPRLIATEAL